MSGQLEELAKQVRSGTLVLLEAAEDDWLLWTPAGTSNHLLWHAGHALWVQDALCIVPLTGESQLPTDWAESFGMHCRPVPQTRHWPSRSRVAELLRRQLEVIVALLGEHAATLSPDAGASNWERTRALIHGLHDEARHQGEMYLLLKQRRHLAAGESP